MKNIILFFPYQYGFHTRAKSKMHKVSFLFLIFFPIAMNAMMINEKTLDVVFVCRLLLFFSAMYMVYEIGYIGNDVFTPKLEKKTTRWLDKGRIKYVQKNYKKLIAIRIIWVALIICILEILHTEKIIHFILTLICLTASFHIHNSIRGRLNVLTDFLLNFFKYTSCLLPFSADAKKLTNFVFFSIIEIVLVRTLEFGIERHYILTFLKGFDYDKNRVKYYSLLTVGAGVFSVMNADFRPLFCVSLYLFLYRLFCLILVRKSYMVQSVKKKYSKD